MKLAVVFFVSFFSLSYSFAGHNPTIKEAVAKIEFDHNVRCELVKTGMVFCLGPETTATCRYTQTYDCDGAKVFQVKLKIKNSLNFKTGERETVVTKVEF